MKWCSENVQNIHLQVEDLGMKRYSVRDASGLWCQNSIQFSDAGNEETHIAFLNNEAYRVYRKETL